MAEGAESSDAKENPKPRSLICRLADIRKECSGVGKENISMSYDNKKTGNRESYTIQGHTIEGVLHGVRGLFDRHGVMMTPQLIERSYNGNRCDVIVDFEFINLDVPEDTKIIRWAGSDTDNGGKGFAKAGTNALKEMLKKTFLITDREDAKEETEQTEYQSDEGLNRGAVEKAKEKVNAAFAAWANSLKAAIESAGSTAKLRELKREHKAQMESEDVPAVTRKFFEDLFAERKRILEEVEAKEAAEAGE